MTVSAEAPSARLRALAHAVQEQALPRGRVVATCGAPFGGGGLGRHLQEIVAALDRRGQERSYICDSTRAAAASEPTSAWRTTPRPPWHTALLAPLARVSPGRRLWRTRVEFDAYAARALPRADHLIAFNRQALAQFQAARRGGYESVALMTGSPHVRRVARQHARALRQYPLERSFGTLILGRYLAEYERADRIHVASRYTWESFVEQGIPEERLARFPLTPDPRYRPDGASPAGGSFDIVYVGSLSVAKGVPLLIDAVRRLPFADLRLLLVGSWKSRGMRRFVEAARAADARIEVCPGDPLAHLRGARLCVHPTFEDGFAYAPAEALACGVPVLVSEDTGMKELVDPGRTGLILPTGDLGALSEAIEAVYRGELLGG
jgi:glycosyltransferase involved in cell wall biosynthesis